MDPAADTWITRARWALFGMAAGNLLLGCALGSAGMLGWNEYLSAPDQYPILLYVLWPLVLLCAGWMPATLQLLAARGLRTGSRFAWGFALFVAAVNLLSCNFPFAAVILYALLLPEVRARFAGRA